MERDRRVEDQFLRIWIQAESRPIRIGSFRTFLRGQGLTERYSAYATESRYQGEGVLQLSKPLGGQRLLWTTGRLEARSYPDNSKRDFQRSSATIGFSSALRTGRAGLAVGLRGIDYRRTADWFDRRSRFFSVEYLRPLTKRLETKLHAEFEWSDYGRPAIKQVDEGEFVEGEASQRDRGRLARLQLRYIRRYFFELGLSWESVRSNSFGYSVGRRAVEGAVGGWLPAGFLMQVRGRLESVSYRDHDLDLVFLIREGEDVEAREDNNRLLLLLRRSIGRDFGIEGRISWFRNESLLVGEYYPKAIGSIGLSWTPSDASDF